jgi:hypothetical protein
MTSRVSVTNDDMLLLLAVVIPGDSKRPALLPRRGKKGLV